MQNDARTVIADLAHVFRRLRVRWYVFGAQAVIAAGAVRFTADVDVTVEAPRAGTKPVVAALSRGKFRIRELPEIETFIETTRVIPAIHVPTAITVDVVIAGTAIEAGMFERAEMKLVGGQDVPFVSLPDLIALKLLAARPKDIEDVQTLVRARPRGLDLEEARRRVRDLGAALDDSAMVDAFDRIVGKKKRKR